MQATWMTKSPNYIILLHIINIRMLHSTFECVATFKGLFQCRTSVYALLQG